MLGWEGFARKRRENLRERTRRRKDLAVVRHLITAVWTYLKWDTVGAAPRPYSSRPVGRGSAKRLYAVGIRPANGTVRSRAPFLCAAVGRRFMTQGIFVANRVFDDKTLLLASCAASLGPIVLSRLNLRWSEDA